MPTMPIRDVSLFVKVIGQGYPLLLMHGGPGEDHISLLPLQGCADQLTLIYYDHRCNGRSDGADISTMTWENLTADAEALRQALGYEKWAVLGHSFGGNVALEYALRYPQSISHLLLMNSGGDAFWPQHNAHKILANRGFEAEAVEACRRFFNGQMIPDDFIPLFLKFAKGYFYHFSLLGMAREMIFGPQVKFQPKATIFGFSQLLKGWTVMDRLGEIKTPTFILAGRYDFLYPPESQAILADRLPNSHLELIECAGHNPHMEQNTVVIEAVKRFLSAQIHAGTKIGG